MENKDEKLEQLIEDIVDQSILEAVGDAVSIQDTDFKVLYQNDKAKRIIGDHVGKYCYTAFENRDDVCEGCPLAETFNDGKVRTTERRNPLRPQLIVEITTSALKDSKGEIIAGIEVVRDVTERKQTEENLKKYKLLISQIKDLAAVCDDKGNVLFLNDVFEKMTNHKPEEFIGKSFAPLLDDENLKIAIDGYTKTLKGESPQFEVRFKDTGILCEFKNMALRNEKGDIIGVTGIGRDITERKQAEEKLQKAKEELEKRVKERTAELETAVEHLQKEITERKNTEEAVLNISKGVSAVVGEKFFYSLTEHLAKTLNADYAYIAEVIKEVPDSVRTLSLYANSGFIDNIEVDLNGTPCDTVREKTCSYPSGVQKLFPHAKNMAAMNVEGYVGTPLTASDGEWLGLMAVMYREPVENAASVESMLKIFAARAAAELERKKVEEVLKIKDKAIESSINAISIADPEANLSYVNSAFIKLWGYDNEKDVLGRSALEFWHDDEKAADVIKTLHEEGSCIGELVARKKDSTLFDVQLSASMVKNDSGVPLCIMASFLDITDQKKAEQHLRDSERKYRNIVDNAIVGVVITTLNGDVHYVNDAFVQMLEYGSTKELMKEKAVTRYKDPAQRETAVKKIREDGRLDNYEIDFITKTGQVKNMLVSSVLGEDIITTLLVDISERRHAEEALRKSEQWLSGLFDQLDEVVFTVSLDRVITYANETIEKMFGFSREEIIGQSTRIVHIDNEHYIRFGKLIESTLIKNDKMLVEFNMMRKNGEVFPVEILGSFMKDETGKYMELIGVVRDITERRKAEEALKIKDSAMESSINAIGIVDPEANVTYVNSSFLKLWGYDNENEVLGRCAYDFMRDEEKVADVIKILNEKGSWTGEMVARKKDGVFFDVQMWASMVKDSSGRPISMMASILDITRLKRSLKQAKKNSPRSFI
jgi:PAS domain S-box-containing protein